MIQDIINRPDVPELIRRSPLTRREWQVLEPDPRRAVQRADRRSPQRCTDHHQDAHPQPLPEAQHHPPQRSGAAGARPAEQDSGRVGRSPPPGDRLCSLPVQHNRDVADDEGSSANRPACARRRIARRRSPMSLTRVLFIAAVLGLDYKLWSGYQQEALLRAARQAAPRGSSRGDARWRARAW